MEIGLSLIRLRKTIERPGRPAPEAPAIGGGSLSEHDVITGTIYLHYVSN